MKSGIFAAALFVASVAVTPFAQAQTQEDPSATLQVLSNVTAATDFVNLAAASDKFEINISNLAQGNTTNKAVMEFARRMVEDHDKATKELLAVAKAAGMSVTPPPALNPRHEAFVNTLVPLRNAEFDAKFIEIQTQAHAEAVALFTSYAAKGDTPELKDIAAKTLPTLQQHLEMLTSMKVQ